MPDSFDSVLHAASPADATWSSINLAEAVPGVMTPLCASLWVPASELGLRRPFHMMGVLDSGRCGIPEDPAQRITAAFFGRMAVRVDFLCQMGDLIPGLSGDAVARDFFGFVPPDYVSAPSLRRLPWVIARYPRTLMTIAGRIERLRAETDQWWRTSIAQIPTMGQREVQTLLASAARQFSETLSMQAAICAVALAPINDQLSALASAAGVDPSDLLRGHGSHEETVVLADLWAVSRERLDVAGFLSRHGYHCPGEGEVESVAWRENPAAVQRLVDQYRAIDDAQAPTVDEHTQRRVSARVEAELMSSLDVSGRLKARVILRLARRFVPLRGVGKVSYLQSLDVVRACARRMGDLLAADDRLEDREDAFYLTADELAGIGSDDLKKVVRQRRRGREEFQSLDAPASWVGQPSAVQRIDVSAPSEVTELAGVGASPGVVEGRAVVVDDPGSTDIEDGDILIAHTTDPSWVSLMFLSKALVVDIGGLMSHAAVVARELGIPCVMNTGTGTTALRSGDQIRVDGAAGTVEILNRVGEVAL